MRSAGTTGDGAGAGETAPADQLGRMAAGAADLADRFAGPLHGLLIACFAGLFVGAARLLTAEVDESWILLSTAYAAGVAAPATEVLGHPTVTTGGLYLLIHALLDRVTTALFAHRAVTLAATAGLLFLAHRALRRDGATPGRAIMGTALFAAVPDLVLQAGLATGEVIATLLLIAAGLRWTRRDAGSLSAVLVTGTLLGLACATRLNCVAAIPALIVHTLVVRWPDRRAIGGALAVAVIAAVIVALLDAGYGYLGSLQKVGAAHSYLATAVGVDKHKTLSQILQAIETANAILPLVLLAGIVGAWFACRERAVTPVDARGDLAGVLLFMGVALLAAWIVIAPTPHLRYLWPGVACIWLAGTVLLFDLLGQARTPAARLTLHGVVATACGCSLVLGALALANGDSLALVYQAMSAAPRLPITAHRFAATADQRALARFVASRPGSARFFTFPAPLAFPIAYLSGRPVETLPSLDTGPAFDVGPEPYFLVDPADRAIWYPEHQFDAWRRAHTSLAFRSGGYLAFRIAPYAPTPRARLRLVGQDDDS